MQNDCRENLESCMKMNSLYKSHDCSVQVSNSANLDRICEFVFVLSAFVKRVGKKFVGNCRVVVVLLVILGVLNVEKL